jgi:hypothetical protein
MARKRFQVVSGKVVPVKGKFPPVIESVTPGSAKSYFRIVTGSEKKSPFVLESDKAGQIKDHVVYIAGGLGRGRSAVAQVGPYTIRRSDGFHTPWEAGTTSVEAAAAVKSAIKRGIELNTKLS